MGQCQHLGEYFFFGDLCFQWAASFLKHRRVVAMQSESPTRSLMTFLDLNLVRRIYDSK